MTTPVTPQLLTVREAAQLARVSEQTIWRRIRSGDIEAVQVGGRNCAVRIDAERLVAWLYSEEAA